MSITLEGTSSVDWHTVSVDDAATQLTVDVAEGLSPAEAAQRLTTFGPNALPTEPRRASGRSPGRSCATR